ncbi:mediator of RNA polymerase II transcription complex subunit 8-domain-containing protein [Xylariales sp. PMI_506]|nr:mediator of RNA polymerase II transcription complex subunit 8-domain-containing protein [Xylariales sp. PMI_506]
MASLNISQEELKAVEQTRQRLFQLSNSINSLKVDFKIAEEAKTMPSLESLQASADILQSNLRSLLDVVTSHNDLFSHLAVHPSTNYPGRTQEEVLFNILRKKPEPDVETSMDEGRRAFTEMEQTVRPENNSSGDGVTDILDGKWESAREFLYERVGRFTEEETNDEYTAEEREMGIENVRTGLRPDFEEFEEDDEDEDGEGGTGGDGEDDIVMLDRPPPPPSAIQAQQGKPAGGAELTDGLTLENMLRIATRGGLK